MQSNSSEPVMPAPPSPEPVKHRKVVIAVDMSKWAEVAFDWYVNDLHKPNTEVICFHSVEPPHFSPSDVVRGSGDQSMHSCEASSKQVEEKFAQKMKDNNISGRLVIRFGRRAGESIVHLANEEHPTMIVIGTRGLGTIRRTILGSVSDYVLHHAHCPVAVCSHN